IRNSISIAFRGPISHGSTSDRRSGRHTSTWKLQPAADPVALPPTEQSVLSRATSTPECGPIWPAPSPASGRSGSPIASTSASRQLGDDATDDRRHGGGDRRRQPPAQLEPGTLDAEHDQARWE